jgi:AcrR family transcriptional regulator
MTTTPAVATERRNTRRSARERLLAAANELFYSEGVHTVGVDRVIEHAGVAKASLYNTFGSKENLVRAYLKSRHHATVAMVRDTVERYDDPRRRLLAVFDVQAELFAQPGFHGCAFIAASAEAPEGGLIEQATNEYRAEIRDLFTELAGDAGVDQPADLARQLQLIFDGAGLAARMDRDPHVAAAARTAAEILLGAATAEH